MMRKNSRYLQLHIGHGRRSEDDGSLKGGTVRPRIAAVLAVSSLFLACTTAFAQMPAAQASGTSSADQSQQLSDQIIELRAQVAELQAAVQQNASGKRVNRRPATKMSPAAKQGMGMRDDAGEMGMPPADGAMTSAGMKDDQGETGGMPAARNAPMSPGMGMGDDKDEMSGMATGSKSPGSPAPDSAMGMCCGGSKSGGNGGMSGMAPAPGGMANMSGSASAMPGQAGASHLYHIGSNGFFLNHSRHITLTQDQTLTLNRLREKAMLDRASDQRKIDEGEQELYTLTAADQPDNAKIRAQIAEIEKVRGDQRMSFIRDVEEASNILTPEQRKVLLGTMSAGKK